MSKDELFAEATGRFIRIMAAIRVRDYAEAHVNLLAHAACHSAFRCATVEVVAALNEVLPEGAR